MIQIISILIILLCCIMILWVFCIKPNRTDEQRRKRMMQFSKVDIAHRGLFEKETDHPENSLPAFQRAVEHGYGIELDVQLTKDGKLVVFHDASLKRMCGIKKKLIQCTYEELCSYPLKDSDENIPLFEEVLKIVDQEVPMIIEVKPEGDCRSTAQELARQLKDYQGIYCVESFHPLAMQWYRKNHPEVLRGQLATQYRTDQKAFFSLRNQCLANLLFNFISRPDFVAYNHKFTHQISFVLCRRLFKVATAAWTIRSQEEYEEAAKYYDMIIFDSFIPRLRGE